MNPKKEELKDFLLFSKLMLNEMNPNDDIDGWFLGTDLLIVPDFDVIIFLDNCVINIDLKHKDGFKKIDKIQKKFLIQNKMFKILKIENIVNIVFFADYERLYVYNNNDWHIITFKQLADVLNKKNICLKNKLENLNEQKDYIISPLKDTEKFFNDRYWLTDAQFDIRNNILHPGMYGIEGSPGTGKSLIAYDFIKKFDYEKKILLIFSGNIRSEHKSFEMNFKNTKFISAKNVNEDILDQYDVVLVDEAQRLHSNSRKIIYNWIKKNFNKKTTAFFYDVNQSLGPKDSGLLMSNLINTAKKDGLGEVYKLSKNIRSNPAIESFANQVFCLSKLPKKNISIEKIKEHIEVKYFENAEFAIPWIESQILDGYTFITPTGDNRRVASSDKFIDLKSVNTHEIIGDELDNVITYIDGEVKYDNSGNLVKCGREYYFNDNEYYVNMTRAKSNLKLAIISNYDVYNAIMEVIFKLKNI